MRPNSPTSLAGEDFETSLVRDIRALMRTPIPTVVLRRGRYGAAAVAFAGAAAFFAFSADDAGAAGSVDSVRTATIGANETLSHIAARHKVSVGALVAVNGIKDEHRIIAGAQILIPTSSNPTGRTATTKVVAAKTTKGAQSFTGPAPKASPGQALPEQLAAHPARVRLNKNFDAAAVAHGVPGDLLKAMAWQESGWQNNATSHVGAKGIGQLMPDTVEFVNSDLSKKQLDPSKPEQNIEMSAIYLRYLLDQTGGDSRLALASYYQGLNAVRTKGVYNDTQAYVRNVVYLQNNYF